MIYWLHVTHPQEKRSGCNAYFAVKYYSKNNKVFWWKQLFYYKEQAAYKISGDKNKPALHVHQRYLFCSVLHTWNFNLLWNSSSVERLLHSYCRRLRQRCLLHQYQTERRSEATSCQWGSHNDQTTTTATTTMVNISSYFDLHTLQLTNEKRIRVVITIKCSCLVGHAWHYRVTLLRQGWMVSHSLLRRGSLQLVT